MAEVSESVAKERRFFKSRGFVAKGTALNASRSDFLAGSRAGGRTQRISGVDVRRAGGSVAKARQRVGESGYTYYRKSKGGSKPTRSAVKSLTQGLKRRLATAQRTGQPLRPRRKRA